MATTGTALRMADGAVAVPHFQEYRMFPDSKRMVSAIVAKVSPEKDEEEMPGREMPEGMKAAAEDILAALGQDYGSGPSSDRGQRQAFEDKRDRLCEALCAFFDQYDAGEGHGEEGDE